MKAIHEEYQRSLIYHNHDLSKIYQRYVIFNQHYKFQEFHNFICEIIILLYISSVYLYE